MSKVLKFIEYMKARFNERSTYAAIGAGIAGAAALPSPWDYVSVAVAIVGTLVPTSGKSDAN